MDTVHCTKKLKNGEQRIVRKKKFKNERKIEYHKITQKKKPCRK